MTDKALSATTAADVLDGTEKFYAVQAGNTRRPTGSQIATYVATVLLAAANTWSAKNTFAAGTITTSQPLTVTQTWNASGITFDGLLIQITSTASAAASSPLRIQVGGVDIFNLSKTGLGFATGGATPWPTGTRSAFEFSNNTAAPPTAHGADLNTWHWTAADGNGMALNVDSFATFSTFGFRRANGTAALPTQVLAGEQIGDIANYVRDNSGYTNGTVGLQFYALNTQTTTDHSSYARFVAVDSGSTTRVGSMLVKANNVVLGDVDAAAAVAQTLSAMSVIAGTSNTAGANLTIKGSIGTGTGVGGRIDLQAAAAGSTGTAQNALSTILSINPITATGASSVGQVSIGTTLPQAKNVFTISANAAAAATADGTLGGPYLLNLVGVDTVATRLVIDGFAAGALINFRRADTTAASPSGLASADQIGGLQWSGYAGASTSAYVAQKATFDVITEAAWSNTDTSTSFRWFTTAAGSTTQTQKMRLWASGGLAVGAANVATDPGAGGILATTATLSGALTFSTAASGPILKQGANGRCGTFVLNGSTPVTVSNSSIAISDAIIISLNTVGGVVGVPPSVATITAATGFTVAGTAADTSTYNYAIIKNAA